MSGFVFGFVGGASAVINVNSCDTISSPGTYLLTTDIINSNALTCISITSSDVVFDGQGYTIDGVDTWLTYGVYVYNFSTALTNVTVKNLRVTDWNDGIYYDRVENGSIMNNTVLSNTGGISLDYSSSNTLINNNANSNNFFGIWLISSSYNTLTGNNALDNGAGIRLDSANNNSLTSNIALNNNLSGIHLNSSSNNLIYNNFFNNTNNFDISFSTNIWNTAKTPHTNIVGGPYLGGNFWAKPDGTGFSGTCTDKDTDGICDSSYTLASGNVDDLPLVETPTPAPPVETPPPEQKPAKAPEGEGEKGGICGPTVIVLLAMLVLVFTRGMREMKK